MTTRTRTRGSKVPSGISGVPGSQAVVTGNFQHPGNGFTYSTGTYPLTNGYNSFTDNRASITDETGSVGNINPCSNSKTIISEGYLPSASFVQKNPLSPFGKMETTLVGSGVGYNLENVMASQPHVSMPDGSAIALARVPSISNEVLSGLNSIYELKDTLDLLNLVPLHFLWAAARRKRAESIAALEKWCVHIERTVRSPLQLLQTIAGIDLMWKFGIKPLVKDIESVHTALENIDRRVQEMLNKRFPCAGMYRNSKAETWQHSSGNSLDTMGCFSYDVSTNRTTDKTWVYGAVKRLDPTKLPSIDVLKHRSLLEKLGMRFDATDVWEAVPWSFVADWFLPIQTFLEQLGSAKPDPSWLLTVGCWSSVKTVTTGTTREVIKPFTASNCVVEAATGLNRFQTYTKSEYVRTKLTTLPGGVPTPYIPEAKLPNIKQFVTGLELALQKVRRKLK